MLLKLMKLKVKLKTSTNSLYKLMILAGVVTLGACAEHTREYDTSQQHFEPRHRFTADLDMYESPSLEPYQETHLFNNGLTSQHPVAGTIPRGFMPYPYPNDTSGYRRAGEEWLNPLESNAKVLEKGEDLFMKFCSHCHGASGEADGSVIMNSKFPPPPSFLEGNSSSGGKLLDLAEGKMFHTITYGKNMMGAHASQLDHNERWMIVSFIKELQSEFIESTSDEPVVAEKLDMTKSERIAAGEGIYMRICIACHQIDGKGIPGAFPPLANSDYLNADIDRAIKIVANGLQGEIVVNGITYNGVMVDNGLTPNEIASVLTFVLNNWDNSGGVVRYEQTKNARD